MKLRKFTLEKLAEMVVGDHPEFPYRSSFYISEFFTRCDMQYRHDGTTRRIWAINVLDELNNGNCTNHDLPSDGIVRVIYELFDEDDFDRAKKARDSALKTLDSLIARDGLSAYFGDDKRCYVRNAGTGTSSPSIQQRTSRPLSREELQQRKRIEEFLDSASEDEFTEKILVPLFKRLGYERVSAAGHKEKIMEFGKDLWMKYRLPTGHWIYFAVQIKKGKIDSSGVGGSSNVANILAQANMAMAHPIFDPDTNKKVLLDHIYLIAGGEITRSARAWLVENLDQAMRRHIIFMYREEILNNSATILKDLIVDDEMATEFTQDISF